MGVIKYMLKGLPYAIVLVTVIAVLAFTIVKLFDIKAFLLVLGFFLTLALALLIGIWKEVLR